jgi:hypothetical protein
MPAPSGLSPWARRHQALRVGLGFQLRPCPPHDLECGSRRSDVVLQRLGVVLHVLKA